MGQEQTLELNNSNCNYKSGVLKHDYAQIEEKDLLPVMKIFYGPLEYEPEKMTIIVGSLVCQFNETKINYKIEDHIAEHDTAIENVLLEQNRTNEIIVDYSEKIDDLHTQLEEHGKNYTRDLGNNFEQQNSCLDSPPTSISCLNWDKRS